MGTQGLPVPAEHGRLARVLLFSGAQDALMDRIPSLRLLRIEPFHHGLFPHRMQ